MRRQHQAVTNARARGAFSLPFAHACGVLIAASLVSVASAQSPTPTPAAAAAMDRIGRAATAAEIRAWDIDVGADFNGLPKGAGSVALGEKVWEAKCASCHGTFGESNQVYTPIVGGTSKQDIEAGRVYYLANPGYPHRTTLMRASRLSTLWDYINRAMPWNAPKSLTPDEVYAVLAYVLSLGDIVPADFTLSDQNIRAVQNRLPNRHGKVYYKDLWEVRGKGDTANPLCMHACPVEGRIASALPDAARNSNGNIAEQVRPFGPARGTDTSLPPRSEPVGAVTKMAAANSAAAPGDTRPEAASNPASASRPNGPGSPLADVAGLIGANSCTGCHGVANRMVGPAFRDIAKKYATRPDAADYLAGRIRSGSQGAWGSLPMPAQAQLSAVDAQTIADWIAGGAK